jgi:hypothetical protein
MRSDSTLRLIPYLITIINYPAPAASQDSLASTSLHRRSIITAIVAVAVLVIHST